MRVDRRIRRYEEGQISSGPLGPYDPVLEVAFSERTASGYLCPILCPRYQLTGTLEQPASGDRRVRRDARRENFGQFRSDGIDENRLVGPIHDGEPALDGVAPRGAKPEHEQRGENNQQ